MDKKKSPGERELYLRIPNDLNQRLENYCKSHPVVLIRKRDGKTERSMTKNEVINASLEKFLKEEDKKMDKKEKFISLLRENHIGKLMIFLMFQTEISELPRFEKIFREFERTEGKLPAGDNSDNSDFLRSFFGAKVDEDGNILNMPVPEDK